MPAQKTDDGSTMIAFSLVVLGMRPLSLANQYALQEYNARQHEVPSEEDALLSRRVPVTNVASIQRYGNPTLLL